MDHLLQEARETSHADPCPFRHGELLELQRRVSFHSTLLLDFPFIVGQVIISKVYLGKSAPAQGGSK